MIFWMQACDKQNKMEKQEKTDYGYNVTVTAPKEYPVAC